MNDRARYLGFAACLGAGIALLVYRFAVMGLLWDSPAKNVLQIGAPVLIVVGSQLLRPIAKKQFPVLLMIVAAVGGAAVSFGICYAAISGVDRTELTERELPGFSIGLPAGTTGNENLDYGHGGLTITSVAGTGNVTEVKWEPGKLLSNDEMTMFAKTVAQRHAGSTIGAPFTGTGPGGAPTISIDLQTPKGTLFWTLMACGGRRIIVMSGGDSAMATLQQRIVASIACHPEAAKESAVGEVPWTVTLPDGWYRRASARPGLLELTNGKDILFVRGLDKMPDPTALPKLLESLSSAAGQKMTIGTWTGDRFPAQTRFDGKPVAGWVMPLECHGQAVLIMGFAADDPGADALAQLVKEKGRCLAPGEAAPPWPAKPQPKPQP